MPALPAEKPSLYIQVQTPWFCVLDCSGEFTITQVYTFI